MCEVSTNFSQEISSESYFAANFMKGTYINLLPSEVIDEIYKHLFKLRFNFLMTYDISANFTKRILEKMPSIDWNREYSLFHENNEIAAKRISIDVQRFINMNNNHKHYFNLAYSTQVKANSFRCMEVLYSRDKTIGERFKEMFSHYDYANNCPRITLGMHIALDMKYMRPTGITEKEFRPRLKKMEDTFVIKIRENISVTYSQFHELIMSFSGCEHVSNEESLENAKQLIKIYYSY